AARLATRPHSHPPRALTGREFVRALGGAAYTITIGAYSLSPGWKAGACRPSPNSVGSEDGSRAVSACQARRNRSKRLTAPPEPLLSPRQPAGRAGRNRRQAFSR